MAKLYFRYGTVSSGKTMKLIIDIYNDRAQGKTVLVLKPKLDTRWDDKKIISRVPGLECDVDYLIEFPGDVINALANKKPDFIYIDEIQFISRDVIELLKDIAVYEKIPVICYGLRSDWKNNLFDGSSAMFALADDIVEIKSICATFNTNCTKKSTVNVKHKNKKPIIDGPQIEVGGEEGYCGMCYYHYDEFVKSYSRTQ